MRPRTTWLRPNSARARVVAWVLPLVLGSLAIVTVTTWLLMIRSADNRMRESLRTEIAEFTTLTEAGVDPATGAPFSTVTDVLRVVITYNLARPNEKFLGYVDGTFELQSRQQAPIKISEDAAFTALVGTTTVPTEGSYDSASGEVVYLAVPVALDGDPTPAVVVAAYFADQERQPADDVAVLMLLVGAGASVVAAVGAWIVAGRILMPVKNIADTATAITDSNLSRRIPHESSGRRTDEMGTLVDSINAMLDRLEAGSAAQRRFLDDAGHELRTPITIVRGHLDVLDTSDPDDVRDTVTLVDDELERMNRLVADLLLLTRAEQTSFVAPTDVDVSELTRTIFDKVHRLADREWVLETTAPVNAHLDEQRMTQAVVALAENATHHTRPGDRIGIGSQLSDSDIRFWVTDAGSGIAEADRERIFERFARGRDGTRRSEGAGLGLSIVTAIARAHGGRVVVGSSLGHGSTFTITVPVSAGKNQ
ncbi:sensor histidine kinase [Rhodococcoides kyotonense]|uniref:histidine kinase n=1 Tax=Rhodococcoides kyotonense TaxID=398843 RepID=A0A239MTJ3_9NOCA|nr:HAMP domain-containing sensor histidine kinase [Rhodococcus kyotonensis]SNT46066.1 Signal transduction histidine kinase [Rhodococcus kyotonensis]